MSRQTRPADFLPARYVINYDVPSPLTCRHRHTCACHGKAGPSPKSAEKEPSETRRKLETEFLDIAGRIALALHQYPEARAAVDRIVAEYRERHPT